jgi:hypothetical protein
MQALRKHRGLQECGGVQGKAVCRNDAVPTTNHQSLRWTQRERLYVLMLLRKSMYIWGGATFLLVGRVTVSVPPLPSTFGLLAMMGSHTKRWLLFRPWVVAEGAISATLVTLTPSMPATLGAQVMVRLAPNPVLTTAVPSVTPLIADMAGALAASRAYLSQRRHERNQQHPFRAVLGFRTNLNACGCLHFTGRGKQINLTKNSKLTAVRTPRYVARTARTWCMTFLLSSMSADLNWYLHWQQQSPNVRCFQA